MATPDEILNVEARLIDSLSPQVRKMASTAKSNFDRMGQNSRRLSEQFSNVTGKIINIKNALIGLAAVQTFKKLVGDVASVGDTFDKMSQRLNISTNFLQEMDFVANLAGTSFQNLEVGIRRLSKQANDASLGLVSAERAFEQIGVTVTDVNGGLKTSEQLFVETTQGLAKLEDKTKQTALAQELFGRSGTSLIPILNQGADAIEEQRKQARELGGVMSGEAIKAAVDYTDSMTRLQFAFRGIQTNFVVPTLRKISDELERFLANGGVDKINEAIETSIKLGRIFFTVFAANKIIGISSSFVKLAADINKTGFALKSLGAAPAVALLASAAVVIEELVDKAGEGAEKLDKLTSSFDDLEKNKALLELRKQFDALIAKGEPLTKTSMMYGQQITGVNEKYKEINRQAKELQGFTFGEAEGQRVTVALLEKRLKISQDIEKNSLGTGVGEDFVSGETVDKAKEAQDKLNSEIDAIKAAHFQRSLQGRMALLEEERQAIVSNELITAEQVALVNQEFTERKLEEQRAFVEEQQKILEEASEKQLALEKEMQAKQDKIKADNKAKQDKLDQDLKRSLEVQAQGRENLTDAVITQSERSLQSLTKNEKQAQKIALAASIIQGFLAVQRALSNPPGPPFTIPQSIATGILAAGNSSSIAAQAFETGGLPVGRNALIKVNESGQESVLNAQATRAIGEQNINALNSGRTKTSITNEVIYSPTIHITGGGNNQDLLNMLKQDKEGFATFFKDEVVAKGFLTGV